MRSDDPIDHSPGKGRRENQMIGWSEWTYWTFTGPSKQRMILESLDTDKRLGSVEISNDRYYAYNASGKLIDDYRSMSEAQAAVKAALAA
jgi:hypothetical protein